MSREYCDRCGKEIKCGDICIDVDARQRYDKAMNYTICMDCGLRLGQFFKKEYSLRAERNRKAFEEVAKNFT